MSDLPAEGDPVWIRLSQWEMREDSVSQVGSTWRRGVFLGTLTVGAAGTQLFHVRVGANVNQHVHPEDVRPVSAIDRLAEVELHQDEGATP